ncbi:MAG: hypothetical protein WBC83_02025 [Minisyncoccia bacterium]
MKIERSETFVLSEIVWRENILTKNDDRDLVSDDFIRFYKTAGLCIPEQKQEDNDVLITIAICILGEKENWKVASAELKKGGWSGASLFFWHLYVQDKKIAVPDTVMLPGILYRDDEIIEWVPVVRHRPIVSILGILRGSETKILMKPSMTLGLAKSRTILISKTDIIKT